MVLIRKRIPIFQGQNVCLRNANLALFFSKQKAIFIVNSKNEEKNRSKQAVVFALRERFSQVLHAILVQNRLAQRVCFVKFVYLINKSNPHTTHLINKNEHQTRCHWRYEIQLKDIKHKQNARAYWCAQTLKHPLKDYPFPSPSPPYSAQALHSTVVSPCIYEQQSQVIMNCAP